MIDESPNLNSADKILEAATKLFAMDSFAAVSIKQISVPSACARFPAVFIAS